MAVFRIALLCLMATSARAAESYNPSPLGYGDHFYVLFDFGFLSCHDALTGPPVYDKQRIRPGGNTAFTVGGERKDLRAERGRRHLRLRRRSRIPTAAQEPPR